MCFIKLDSSPRSKKTVYTLISKISPQIPKASNPIRVMIRGGKNNPKIVDRTTFNSVERELRSNCIFKLSPLSHTRKQLVVSSVAYG